MSTPVPSAAALQSALESSIPWQGLSFLVSHTLAHETAERIAADMHDWLATAAAANVDLSRVTDGGDSG